MKLLYSPTSPYARKARVIIHLLDLADQIELIATCPFADKETLIQSNPLGKVPTLVLDDNSVLFDSDVICDYLNIQGAHGSLWPSSNPDGKFPPSYWSARARIHLGNGIMDAAFALVMERKRPLEEQSIKWKNNYASGIQSAANAANSDIKNFQSSIGIDSITIACALGYVDFRLPDIDWRHGNEALSHWYEDFANQSAMLATKPPQ